MSKNYGPRKCIICGCEYIPRRSDQKTCGSKECMKERQKLNWLEYRKNNYAAVLKANRRYMAKRREERKREEDPPKKDTIVAIGYAERQKQKTLAMAGKVNTEL